MQEMLSGVYKGTIALRDQGPGPVFSRGLFPLLFWLLYRQDFALKILSLACPRTLREVSEHLSTGRK
jgi:hypothetical protein